MMLSCVLLMLSNDVAIKLFFYNPQASSQQETSPSRHTTANPRRTSNVLHTISNIGKHKCTINNTVLDSCTIANKWHQSAVLVWYDCPIHAKMMVLSTLLRHSIHHDDNHQRKKCMNAQSTLRRWCHMFYKNPSKSIKKTTCQDILLCREEVHLTPMKLDESISSWHNTNIGVVCGKSLRMSTPSRNQSLAMGEEDYFLWCEMMERRQQENERWMQTLLRQMER
ncbi:hypothetical protein CK203_064358 [Vitis vinifera]|uniref:Uncharacterized protein n=1 Tax=Vitis vinifera TaxID=29760 RepID=A0A438FPI4_VITVI|nr:hypothetical protein CK203_064358 [Vitis vinifera]